MCVDKSCVFAPGLDVGGTFVVSGFDKHKGKP